MVFGFATVIPVWGKNISGEKGLSIRWISLTASNIRSLLIQQPCAQVQDRDIAVEGLSCDYLAQEEQSTANMLGAILNQPLPTDVIPGPVPLGFHNGKRGFGARAVELSSVVKILKTTIASVSEVSIWIGGWDECHPQNRQELLDSLRDSVLASPAPRVFPHGRPHIQGEIERSFSTAIMILLTPTFGNIEKYLKRRLD